jgi:hypothetical protein
MNPWEIWLWPWIVASALTRRALETGHGPIEVVVDALQFPGPPANEKDHRTVETFLRWQRRTSAPL